MAIDRRTKLDLTIFEKMSGSSWKCQINLLNKRWKKNLNNPNTRQRSYWKIINKFMNNCKAPKIPPPPPYL